MCLLFIWATKMSVCQCRWANTSTTVNWHSDSIHVVNESFPFLSISPSVSISVFLPHLFIISTSEMDKYNPMMFKKKGQRYWKWQHTHLLSIYIDQIQNEQPSFSLWHTIVRSDSYWIVCMVVCSHILKYINTIDVSMLFDSIVSNIMYI